MKKRRRRISDFKPNLTLRSGLAWFETPENYARILEIMGHPEDMTRSYDRWREVTENKERSLKRGGRFMPIRVVIDPDKFVAWCAARSMQPDRNALSHFVEISTGRIRAT